MAEPLIAADVFHRWKNAARSAVSTVTIFSPYLTATAVRVLQASSIAPEKCVVVTCPISASLLLEAPGQLIALKRLLSAGHPVLCLAGLHAKVLLVDDARVILGSQNFTSQGRENLECSADWPDTIVGSAFLEELLNWRSRAEPLDPLLVDALIARLRTLRTTRARALGAVQAEVLAIREELARKVAEEEARLEAERREEEQRELLRRQEQSNVQLSGKVARAQVRWLGWSADYYSLVVYTGVKLTDWIVRDEGCRIKLRRLNMYPAYIEDTGRMAFVRLAQGKITYFRSSVKWDKEVFGFQVSKTISFPADEVRKRNIVISLVSWRTGKCDLHFLCSGVGVSIHMIEFSGDPGDPDARDELSRMTKEFFTNQHNVERFIEDSFAGFRFRELERDRKNVTDYLPSGAYYRIALIQIRSAVIVSLTRE